MTPPRAGVWLEEIRQAIVASGLPAGIGIKPDTSTGQPWCLLSVLSTTFDGDISVYDDEQNALLLARSVGSSVQQADAAYWRADAAIRSVTDFDGGKVIYSTRDSLTTPVRDDTTFPDRSVYHVDAVYRLWLSPVLGA